MYERILVVEDDTTMRNMLVDRLMNYYYEVIQAEDGEQAVAKFFTDKPHLILLDIMLPKLNGFEVLQAIGERLASPTLLPPIIILSNFNKPEYLARAKEFNAREYLIKSQTEIEVVCDKIAEVFKNK